MIAPFLSSIHVSPRRILRAVSISFRDGFVRATYHEVGRLCKEKKKRKEKGRKRGREGGKRVRDTSLVIMVLSEWSANARFVSSWNCTTGGRDKNDSVSANRSGVHFRMCTGIYV